MTWNYLEGSEQRGPVTEADFDALVRSGKITDVTYVWREGMAEWQPYGQVRGAGVAATPPILGTAPVGAGQVVCAQCGGTFSPDQVIRHGNAFICASCKPIFLQKIKEGLSVGATVTYAGFWVRFGAKFLDGIIVGIFLYSIIFGMYGLHQAGGFDFGRMGFTQLLTVVLGGAYYTFFVGKFGATPGKMAAKLLVVNADGSKVSYAKALGRFFAAEYISGCFTLCIGYLMIAWDPEKRGLHDRICSTRVIRK